MISLFLIPYDIINLIVLELDLKSLLEFTKTCKTCKHLCISEKVWENRYRTDFKNIGHIDLTYTWRKSYSETYTTINEFLTNLIQTSQLNLKYLNIALLKKDLRKCIFRILGHGDEFLYYKSIVSISYNIMYRIYGDSTDFIDESHYDRITDSFENSIAKLAKKFGIEIK